MKTNSCVDHGATSNVSTDPPPQCKVYSQDDFSKLPDHIITGHILPHLDWKERVRSSVLSRRWKYLWRCSLGTNLVFPYGVSNPVFLGECPASFPCFPKCLTYVNNPGETLEYLLSCCPFLELLSLHSSLSSNLKICGPSLKLEHLEIMCCLVPLKVEVSAPNLITLKHDGLREDLLLKDVPLLVDLLMSGTYFNRFVNEFVRHFLEHFSYFFQLKTLELIMASEALPTSVNFPLELPTLVKLEELKVVMETHSDDVMFWPIVMLKAAPYLQRFFVKVDSFSCSYA